ncbi:MAG: leucyl aminopeptidase, partial [Acidimicrobiales bacterium]
LSMSPEQVTIGPAGDAAAQAWLVSPDGLDDLPAALGADYQDLSGFKAKAGQRLSAAGADGLVIAVGIGEDITLRSVRAAAGELARVAGRVVSLEVNFGAAATELGSNEAVRVVTEGILLGGYTFTAHKSDVGDEPNLSSVALVSSDGDAGLTRGRVNADGAAFARDLVNEPGGTLTPSELADRAQQMAADAGLESEIWDITRIREERLGGLLAVNQGSVEEPRMIKISYKPEGAPKKIALVGKGITFDSGGLSIKPAAGMMTMKTDMGGAAAVISAMKGIAALAPAVEVVSYVCSTDNMTGGAAVRPGDVFTARNGKTVEVLNTDAEGRLVLADGLSLAAEDEPDGIVDCATLTGACMVALGGDIAGHMGNDEEWTKTLLAAADRVGESAWELPLHKAYRSQLDSKVADLKNIGSGRFGGAIVAGLFLQEFVGDCPWVHIDLAGPADGDKTVGELTNGGSGYGAMTLIELVVAATG